MIKSTIVENEDVSVFPKLMIIDSNDFIILVTGDDGYFLTGFVVYSNNKLLEIGYSSTYWEKSRYSDFKGSITLKN